MAVDTQIPVGKPGVASFDSETFGGPADVRYGDGPLETTNISLTASGADVDLPLYSVIDNQGAGLLSDAVGIAAAKAHYVLAEPIFIADGATMIVPVIRSGHLNMDVLNWDVSYSTDALKKAAFESSVSPTIFVSKPKHNADAIY